MSENASSSAVSTDLETIRLLVRLMHKYDLTAIDLVEAGTQIRLRRGGKAAPVQMTAPVPGYLPAAPIPMASGEVPAVAPPTAPAAPAAPSKPSITIDSPMVGTFYAASAPDTPPFVQVGSVIRENSTVGVIEAMKVFTEIPAGLSGTIAEVLVKNGQAVEYGQPLFRVETA